MKTVVRKIKNISEVYLPVKTTLFNTIILPPGKVLENENIYNLEELQGKVEVEMDLSEVVNTKSGLQQLRD